MAKRRTRLEMLGLMKATVPAAMHEFMRKRIDAVRRLHLTGPNLTVNGMPAAVERFGADCYLQGVIDGAQAGANNPSLVDGIGDSDG